MKVGLRYHEGKFLSFLTVGLQRGSERDLRIAFKQVLRWLTRAGYRVEYHAVWVIESDRVHVHVIWTAPFIPQAALVDQFQAYLGENCHVYIKGVTQRSVGYSLQYQVNQGKTNQDIKLRFSHSRGWLPEGYNAFWRALIKEFRVKQSHQQRITEKGQFIQMTQCSDIWWEALLQDCDAWIVEQRKKGKIMPISQAVLTV